MFMLICPEGKVLARQVRLPQPNSTARPKRTQRQWMEKMHLEALGWKVRYYAFRHGGDWHLCDALTKHEPIRSIKDGEQTAAEMWLMMKERADAERLALA